MATTKKKQTAKAPAKKQIAEPNESAPDQEISPAKKKARRKSTPIISIETYNKMFAAYIDRQSAYHVAKTAGVSERTAKRYIKQGHPKRGLASLQDRLAKINDMTRQQVDFDLARARAEFQSATRAAFVKLTKRITSMEPAELSADKIPDHLAKLLSTIERTFGEAEHTHEIRGQFSNMTLEELRQYIEEGVVPEE